MSASATKACPRCRAENRQGALHCWLCGLELRAVSRRAAPGEAAPALIDDVQVVPEGGGTFSLTTLFLLITLLAVCFGLFAIAPGLSILLAIAVGPAFLRTLLVSYHRQKLGREVTPGRKVALFFMSVATIVMMAVVVIVAAMVALCVICFATLANRSSEIATMIGAGTAVCVGGLFLVLIWARYRYDVTRD
jgi:hypothetical protein